MASRTTFDPEREITDRIIAAIEAGTPPWRKPWTGAAGGVAFPLRVTGKRYRGINVPMLWLAAAEKGYSSAHWMTYRQAAALWWAGAQGRKVRHRGQVRHH
jgi:antirestriction protein ArdC